MAETLTKQQEVDRNYEAFKGLLPELLKEHGGKFALLRNGEVVELFDSARDAMIHGHRTYDDNLYSVQEITDQIVDLGFFSCAVPDSPV